MSTFIFRDLASEVEKETIDNILSLSQKDFSLLYTFLLKYFIDCHENLLTQFSNFQTILEKRQKTTSLHWRTKTAKHQGQRPTQNVFNAFRWAYRLILSLTFKQRWCLRMCISLYCSFCLDYLILMALCAVHSPGTQTRSLVTGMGIMTLAEAELSHTLGCHLQEENQPQGSTDLRLKWSSI